MNKVLTKDYIKNLGYEVDEIGYRVFLVKDFIKDEELQVLLDQAKSASEDEWKIHYMDSVVNMAKLKFGRSDIENLVKEGLYEITDNWVDKNLYVKDKNVQSILNDRCQQLFNFTDDLVFAGCGIIQRQYDGVPLKDHVDNHTDPSLEYALVIYLNDDYTNGEVYFVNQGIELRPPKKSILIFPTSEEWRHGVKEPGEGPHRYVIPSFIRRKNFWEKHKENGYNLQETLSELKGD
jgi:hypothetical protein